MPSTSTSVTMTTSLPGTDSAKAASSNPSTGISKSSCQNSTASWMNHEPTVPNGQTSNTLPNNATSLNPGVPLLDHVLGRDSRSGSNFSSLNPSPTNVQSPTVYIDTSKLGPGESISFKQLLQEQDDAAAKKERLKKRKKDKQVLLSKKKRKIGEGPSSGEGSGINRTTSFAGTDVSHTGDDEDNEHGEEDILAVDTSSGEASVDGSDSEDDSEDEDFDEDEDEDDEDEDEDDDEEDDESEEDQTDGQQSNGLPGGEQNEGTKFLNKLLEKYGSEGETAASVIQRAPEKKKHRIGWYDHEDPFIDDTELLHEFATFEQHKKKKSKAKPKEGDALPPPKEDPPKPKRRFLVIAGQLKDERIEDLFADKVNFQVDISSTKTSDASGPSAAAVVIASATSGPSSSKPAKTATRKKPSGLSRSNSIDKLGQSAFVAPNPANAPVADKKEPKEKKSGGGIMQFLSKTPKTSEKSGTTASPSSTPSGSATSSAPIAASPPVPLEFHMEHMDIRDPVPRQPPTKSAKQAHSNITSKSSSSNASAASAKGAANGSSKSQANSGSKTGSTSSKSSSSQTRKPTSKPTVAKTARKETANKTVPKQPPAKVDQASAPMEIEFSIAEPITASAASPHVDAEKATMPNTQSSDSPAGQPPRYFAKTMQGPIPIPPPDEPLDKPPPPVPAQSHASIAHLTNQDSISPPNGTVGTSISELLASQENRKEGLPGVIPSRPSSELSAAPRKHTPQGSEAIEATHHYSSFSIHPPGYQDPANDEPQFRVEDLDPLPSQILGKWEEFQELRVHETFDNPAKFPERLKPVVYAMGMEFSRMTEYGIIPGFFFDHLTLVLPYNRYTLKRFVLRKVVALRSMEVNQDLENVKNVLKRLIDNRIAEQNLANNHLPSASSADSATDSNNGNSKFRFNDRIKQALSECVRLELTIVYLQNDLKSVMDRQEYEVSEMTVRKRCYSQIATFWPEGMMTSAEVSRAYHDYKCRMKKKAQRHEEAAISS